MIMANWIVLGLDQLTEWFMAGWETVIDLGFTGECIDSLKYCMTDSTV